MSQTKLLTMNASVGDTIRCNFAGGSGTHATVKHHSQTWQLSRPGTQSVDFTYKGGEVTYIFYPDGLPNNTMGITVNPSSPKWQFFESNKYRTYRANAVLKEVAPRYIERLTQLSTNTSHLTKNSLQ